MIQASHETIMAYILDADWVINALARRRQAAAILNHLAPEGIAISWITIGEVYEGAFNAPEPHHHLATFRQFLSPFRVLGVNDPIMERFTEIRSLLRTKVSLSQILTFCWQQRLYTITLLSSPSTSGTYPAFRTSSSTNQTNHRLN
jgi:predicted nucleic acid-binding protein